jgi:hypothetical protein
MNESAVHKERALLLARDILTYDHQDLYDRFSRLVTRHE